MKLSVILPCFNGSATLTVQLEALTRQEWAGGWEVIAVDNGSTDNSVEIVKRYEHRLPDLKIVQAYTPGTKRLGVPHSYNTGIKAASGDAFVFCEADDEVAAGWLQAMGEALAEHPFVVGRLEHRKLNPEWLHPPYGDGYQYAGLSRARTPPYLESASAASFGLRRSLYTQLGPLSLDFPMGHDQEYSWRAQVAGHALHFEPRAVVHYREKTRWRDRFRQGRNWGWDSHRIEQHYGAPTPRFALPRQGLHMVRLLPAGIAVALWAATGRTGGRRQLAEWIFNFGWAVGKARALLARPAQANPITAPRAADELNGPATASHPGGR
ncbi:glycosyltransferase family 2 protein [Ramlibacter henchirensis]|uniref:glycosyltransferase family 2 protein n=1 Tax=Ramlibacter henchirensis TaxID=204072 RepID=UPI001430C57B|nr:glycosyltransferase family 2 protein [Ramlibacter henchirensis]